MLISVAGFDRDDKKAVGGALARRLGVPFEQLNSLMEQRYYSKYFERFGYLRVMEELGLTNFQAMERQLLVELTRQAPLVITLGNATLMHEDTRHTLRDIGLVVYLEVDPGALFNRLRADGKPRFLEESESTGSIDTLYTQRKYVYDRVCDILVNVTSSEPDDSAAKIIEMLELTYPEQLQQLFNAPKRNT